MDNPFFILLACSLAVFRLAEAVSEDNGPFHVFKLLRESCRGHPILCEFVTCPYCLGGWLSILAVAMLVRLDLVALLHCVLWWAAIWGGQAAVLRSVRERK